MSQPCLRIITGAMRKLGVLAIGREPTAAQGEQGLETLQYIYQELIGQGVFGPLHSSHITSSTYEAHESERVVISSAVTTVTLPTTITNEWEWGPFDGPRDYGWSMYAPSFPRPPGDSAIIQIARSDLGTAETWIYDGPRATWVALESLTLATIAPLSDRYNEAIKALLALKLAPVFNVQPNPILMGEYARANSILSTRFDRPHRYASGEYM